MVQLSKLSIASIVGLVVGLIALIVGIVLIIVGSNRLNSNNQCSSDYVFDSTIAAKIKAGINPENLKSFLKNITKQPHQAGTDANNNVGDVILETWKSYGLEDVHFNEYEVLLSYPNFTNPNLVQVIAENGSVVYQSEGFSPVLVQDEQTLAGIQWLAYSSDGDVTGDIVYANKGTEEDFAELEKQGITIKDRIVLVRYGGIFRGNKAKNAATRGAKAVILYSDPEQAAKDGIDPAHTYNSTVYMPAHGVQRGSLLTVTGDPLTPLYPSLPQLVGSRTVEETKQDFIICPIPVIPLSYSSAQKIFEQLQGDEVIDSFKGKLDVIYRYGPGLANNQKTRVVVHANTEIKKIRNVIGYIWGREEPDRYVIVGNHYDAWVYGSMDPNSGTSVLAETIRSTVEVMRTTGWRPARTILFANWDAEEYGLIGSTEFVEEFQVQLTQRAVVNINLDLIQGNQSLTVQANPSLVPVVREAALNVANPRQDEIDQGRKTAYDSWTYYYPESGNSSQPTVKTPSGGSDHFHFYNYLGIPIVAFTFDTVEFEGTYPLYHTMYETPFLNEHLLDVDNFKIHQALAHYFIELMIKFSDSPTVPIDPSYLANALYNTYIPQFEAALNKFDSSDAYNASVQTKKLKETAQTFVNTSLASKAKNYDNLSLDERRRQNDRLNLVERCFVNPRGVVSSPLSRNVLLSASGSNFYGSAVLSQLYSTLSQIESSTDSTTTKTLYDTLTQQISQVHFSLICANASLKEILTL